MINFYHHRQPLQNLKKGGKSWRGLTTKDIPALEKKIQEDKELQDLKKALWYLEHHINTLEKK